MDQKENVEVLDLAVQLVSPVFQGHPDNVVPKVLKERSEMPDSKDRKEMLVETVKKETLVFPV